MAWTFSIGLILAAAALSAWGLNTLLQSRPVLIPIARPDQVIDFGGPPPAASPDASPSAVRVGPDEPLILVRNPSWIIPPKPEFPDKALRLDVKEGKVALTCTANAAGRLTDCVIHEETPAGAGFGEASLAAAREAVLRPRLVDGKPTDGKITYTNRFRMD